MSDVSNKLFDVLGPKGRKRSRLFGTVIVAITAAIFAFIVYQLMLSGQFEANKWRLFTFRKVQEDILIATLSTFKAFASGVVLSSLLSVVLVLIRISSNKYLRFIGRGIVETFRGVPLLILMMMMYYGLPVIGVQWMTPFWAVVLALTIYNGAVLAEILRAGILAVDNGQMEGGLSIGLSKMQIMRLIVGPQAIRIMLPTIISQWVIELKDTSLGFMVTYPELLYLSKFYGSQINYGSPIIPAAIIMGSIYILSCLLLSWLANRVEAKSNWAA